MDHGIILHVNLITSINIQHYFTLLFFLIVVYYGKECSKKGYRILKEYSSILRKNAMMLTLLFFPLIALHRLGKEMSIYH